MSDKPLPPEDKPIIVPLGGSPAEASRPDQELDGAYNTYAPNPAPWWIGLLWACYLIGAATYLYVNLTR